MKTMSALEAKNAFGHFLATVQREPVVVTKNSREVVAMFSVEDLQEMAASFLAEPIKADVDAGKLSVIDALMTQVKINQRVEKPAVRPLQKAKALWPMIPILMDSAPVFRSVTLKLL